MSNYSISYMGRINFDLEENKHLRFKTKTSSEGTTITDVLKKFIDGYIGKWEVKSNPISSLEVGVEVKKKSGGVIQEVELKEVSIMGENGKENLENISVVLSDNTKEKKLEALRDLIGGVPQNSPAENQDIPAEDLEETEEVSYTEDKQ